MTQNNINSLIFNRSDEENAMDNLRTKFYNYINTSLSVYQGDSKMFLNFEKVIAFFTNNLDFVLVNMPIFQMMDMVKRDGNFYAENRHCETKSISCDNYLYLYNEILNELEQEENKNKVLIIYNIIISHNYNSYNIMYDYNDTMFYRTTIRYVITDIGMSDVMNNFKKIKKRKDIADYYNPKKAMRFKQYVSEERKKIDRRRSYRNGQIPTFERLLRSSHMLNE